MRSGQRSTTSSETPTLKSRSTISKGGALLALAWLNVALHALGLVMAWIGLRPGSTIIPLADRMAYLASQPPAWKWGWGIWMLCAVVLVAFMTALRSRLPGNPVTGKLALIFTIVGMTADLFCDVLQIRTLPVAAAAGSSRPAIFLAFEQLVTIGGLAVANGLYTLGVLLMNLCLRDIARTATLLVGWVAVISGFALAATGFVSSPALLQAATGLTIGAYSLWTVLVARDLR